MAATCWGLLLASALLLVASTLDLVGGQSNGDNVCTNHTDCYPPSFSNNSSVPTTLVECVESSCQCRDCFIRNASSGRCEVDEPCQQYDIALGECEDDRLSQRVAFLLSIFLSSTGAANFYIERFEFAVPQLLILVIVIVCAIVSKILQQFKERHNNCLAITSWITVIIVIVATLTIVAWWIADLVIFVQNDRSDGDDCPLDEDL